jgi:CHAT domain
VARAARAALSACALLCGGCAAAAPAQPQTSSAPPLPTLQDLPHLQGDLRAELASYDQAHFLDYVLKAFYAAGTSGPESADRLAELRALADERALPLASLSNIDLQYAYFVAAVIGDRARAVQMLEAALERDRAPSAVRAQLALQAESIERDEEHWNAARLHLAEAEEALTGAPDSDPLVARLHGDAGRLWIDLGLPDVARPHVEAELQRARGSLHACVDELQLLSVELDYDAIDARFRELPCEAWYQGLSLADQGLCQLYVASAWLVREHDGLAPRGSAAQLLDDLLPAGRIDPARRPWVVRHRAVCAADEGDWPRARALCAELACDLGAVGAPDDFLPPGRLGAALVALEARIELAAAPETPGRAARLRVHLERLRRSWREFLENWSGAPVRGGGLAYLGLAERHQLLQELIELELAVEGEQRGAQLALEEVLEAELQSSSSRRMQLPRVDLAEAQRELTGARAGLLVYLPSRERSFVFALDPRGLRLFHLGAEFRVRGPSRALAAAAQSAVREGRGLDDRELVAAAADCARVLLPPELEEHIAGWQELLVVGLDDFGYVPLELLPAREGGTQGARRAIRYAPSIPMALFLGRRVAGAQAEGARLLLALGGSQARELADALPGRPEVLTGEQACAARLGLAQGEHLALVYVLAHGTLDPALERPGGLRLVGGADPGGAVRAEEIEALRSAPLVVLTACKAGRAPLRRGDGGRSDLAAAFLYAGADTVVLPTCDLELDATLRIAPLIFRRLSAGEPVAEALRATREELAARGDGSAALQAHLLHVVGSGTNVLSPRPAAPTAGSWRMGPWILALGALALLWFARSRARSRS